MPRGRAKGYANRTDLQAGKPLPISAPTGMPYGDNKALKDAQRAVPMAGTQSPTPAANTPQTAPMASGTPLPVVPLTAPTQRPSEPITTGLPSTTASSDVQTMKATYLPYFENALRYQNVPEQFASFVSWLRAQ